MTEYRAVGGRGEIAFATRVPWHIQPAQVGPGMEYMILPPWLSLCDRLRFSSELVSSNPSVRESSAETGFCCRR